MGKAPTVAECSTEPPTRATGGEGGTADDDLPPFEPERLRAMTRNSFSARLSPPADPCIGLPDGTPKQAACHQKEMSSTPQKQGSLPLVI
jgi:hypothetical protein